MRRHVIPLLVITFAVLLAYSNTLKSPWVMDDFLASRTIEVSDFQSLLGFRKITYVTFLLNSMVFPFNPAGLRFVNILIHILNVSLVYVLGYKTMTLVLDRSGPESRALPGHEEHRTPLLNQACAVAFLSSAIFALHPMNINAVAYIIQRSASLATFFVLLSLLVYIRARQSSGSVRAFLFYGVSGVSMVLGIFSKENAVMAVPLIILYDYVFLSKFRARELLKRLSVITGMGIVMFIIVSYAWNLHRVIIELAGLFFEPDKPIPSRGWTAINVSWTPLQHVLTEFRVLSRYLFLLILPLPQLLVFDFLGLPLSTGLFHPVTTMFSILLVSFLIVLPLLARKRFSLLFFGLFWYFIAISLESFFALGSDLYFEHRNYLPLSGLVIGVAGHGVVTLGDRLNNRRVWSIAIILIVSLGTLTFSRNEVWQDSMTLWEDTIRKNPLNHRAHYNLGNAYGRKGRRDRAIEHYTRAIALDPDYADAHVNLGVARVSQGRMEEAIGLFQKAIEIKPSNPKAHYNLGKAYQLEGLLEKAVEQYTTAIDLKPEYPQAHSNLGAAYHSQGRVDKAIEHYRRAIELKPDSRGAHFNLGKAYESMGLLEEAEREFATAERLRSKSYEKR